MPFAPSPGAPIGVGIAMRRTARVALLPAVAISVFYMLAGTFVLPRLWLDPVGPMLKIWSIIVLNLLRAHFTNDAQVIAGVARIVVTADFVFTATAVVAQPVTGYLLARFLGYPVFDGWIALSLVLYGVTGAFWAPVVFMQIRMRDLAAAAAREGALPRRYHRLFRTWFVFGFPAFAAVLGILWLMITRPVFSFR